MTAIAVPNTFAFSDAAVFGRLSDKVVSYMNRYVDEAPVAPSEPTLVDTMVARFAEYRAKRAVVRQLNMLSDRMLADIGLNRHELASIAA